MSKIQIIDRKSKQIAEENVMGGSFINFAYDTMLGRFLSKPIFLNSVLSRLLGLYFDSPFSKKNIRKTVDRLGIDESEFEKKLQDFSSFNDFFTRKLKDGCRPFSSDKKELSCPAEGRVKAYSELKPESTVKIKGFESAIKNLFFQKLTDFSNFNMIIIRLAPLDYHRFHFPCDGSILGSKKISGSYYSVNPLAQNKINKIFMKNKREFSLLKTDFGKMLMCEIGAFGVGTIKQSFQNKKFRKMDEKGFFKFGGSTVILMWENLNLKISEDLLKNTEKKYETLTEVGETVAEL